MVGRKKKVNLNQISVIVYPYNFLQNTQTIIIIIIIRHKVYEINSNIQFSKNIFLEVHNITDLSFVFILLLYNFLFILNSKLSKML